MGVSWFCKVADREIGPLELAQLKVMAARGSLRRDDLIRQGVLGPWVPAARYKGLFPEKSPEGLLQAQALPMGVPIADSVEHAPLAEVATAGPPPLPKAAAMHAAGGNPSASGEMRAHLTRQRRQRQQQRIVLFGSTITVGILVVVGAALWLNRISSVAPRAETTVASKPVTTAKTGATSLRDDTEDDDLKKNAANPPKVLPKPAGATDLGIAGTAATAQPTTSGKQLPAASSPTAEASKATAKAPPVLKENLACQLKEPNVTVTITAMQLGLPARVHVAGPAELREKERFFSVTLSLVNHDSRRKLEFRPWSATESALLRDDLGNTYRQQTIVSKDWCSLYPDKPLEQFLIFEPPLESAAMLQLDVPAEALGGKGMLTFGIPRAKIAAADEAPAAAAAAPQPAAKPPEATAPVQAAKPPEATAPPQSAAKPAEATAPVQPAASGGTKPEPAANAADEYPPRPLDISGQKK